MSYALVILTGGLSSRMGTDKALLPFGKRPLLLYQFERFRSFFSKIYLSVPDADTRNYQNICNCPVIADHFHAIGPIGGICSCLEEAEEDLLFFISVDSPFTDPAFAQEMCREMEQMSDQDAGIICDAGRRIQPVYAVYRKSCLPAFRQMIQQKIYRPRVLLQDLLRKKRCHIFDHLFPEEQFFNMNTPDSYYHGLHLYASRHPGEFPAFCVPSRTSSVPVLGFSARSGTGKTTYLERLIPLLKNQGLRIAVIKHDVHGLAVDTPGKDSWRLSQAGADQMVVSSPDQTVTFYQHPKNPPALSDLTSKICDCDLILTEGYKFEDIPRIALLRRGYQEIPAGNTDHLIALVADFAVSSSLPVFSLNQPEDIVPFIMDYIHQNG